MQIISYFRESYESSYRGEKVAMSYSDTVKSPVNEKNLKRGLSLSPEVVESDNKLLRSKQRNKKVSHKNIYIYGISQFYSAVAQPFN